MELQRVTFEQAKKLKELGFSESVDCWYEEFYDEEDHPERSIELFGSSTMPVNNWNASNDKWSAPTLEIVAKWLREKKKLAIIVESFEVDDHYFWINDISEFTPEAVYTSPNKFSTYEDALSAGIDEALKVIV